MPTPTKYTGIEFTEEMFWSTTTGEIGDTDDDEKAKLEVVTALNMLVRDAI